MSRPISLATALLLGGCLRWMPAQVQNQNPQEAAANLVRMHQAWGPAASSPNTKLSLQEQGRSSAGITFRLLAEGLSKDGMYTLVAWPVNQRGPIEAMKGIMIGDSGVAVCAGKPGTCGSPGKPNDPIDLKLNPIAGEPVRLGLVSADQSSRVFVKLVPVPIRGEDRGCAIEAILLTPGSELVLIDGIGFPPSADVTMDTDSEGERHAGQGKVGADGRYSTAILPYKQGTARGTAKVNLKSDKCSPVLSFPWGRRN
jgi:hypothetical protein